MHQKFTRFWVYHNLKCITDASYLTTEARIQEFISNSEMRFDLKLSKPKILSNVSERVTGRKARGLQMEERGYKCQTLFISPLSGRRRQTTSVRFFPLKILCFHDDTWFHLNLTYCKPWVSQCVFLMEMFFLSYANEAMYLLGNLPFFKMVPPRTNFWLILAQQTSIHINGFMAGGWHTSYHSISKMCAVGEETGET